MQTYLPWPYLCQVESSCKMVHVFPKHHLYPRKTFTSQLAAVVVVQWQVLTLVPLNTDAKTQTFVYLSLPPVWKISRSASDGNHFCFLWRSHSAVNKTQNNLNHFKLAHLNLDTISSSIRVGWCQSDLTGWNSVLSYLPLRYTWVGTDVHRYGNLIHLYISAETCRALLFPTTTVQIKPNYTILLFLFSNEEGLLGVGGDVT